MVAVVFTNNISAQGYIFIAIFFGFFSGVFVALPAVIYIALTQDKSRIGSRIGLGFAMIGFGVMAGGPGGGAILGTEQDWTSMWSFGGGMLLASSSIFVLLRLWLFGFKLNVKA